MNNIHWAIHGLKNGLTLIYNLSIVISAYVLHLPHLNVMIALWLTVLERIRIGVKEGRAFQCYVNLIFDRL